MSDCIFCQIVSGSIPSSKLYEDDQILAFRDINPQAVVHFIVIPKQHIDSADRIDASNSAVVARIFEQIPQICAQLGLRDGYRVLTNVGKHGAQSVKHLHFHVLGGEQLSERLK